MQGERITFAGFGNPEDVVAVEKFEVGQPGPGQVLLRMESAPINPADLNFIEGVYGLKPSLPAAAGLEGCGTVLATGDGVSSPADGDRVVILRGHGSWSSHLICPAADVLAIPREIPAVQACMLKVNPMTAYRMLAEGTSAPVAGSWVAQNAANSGVGQCVIQIARALGLKTINLVRRDDAIASLQALGADCVMLDEPGVVEKAPGRPSLALNAVGGDSATRLMDLLADGGCMTTYGAMSRQGVKVPNKFLLFKGITLRGFWLTRWLREASAEEIAASYDRLAALMADGKLAMAVEKSYPLAAAADAIRHAKQGGRQGKILLSC
jgi:NADPH:quinone reductase-like Zn-dependent oxidoreductase